MAIEKSVNTIFDVFDNTPLDSIIGFWKIPIQRKFGITLIKTRGNFLMKTLDKIPTGKIERAGKLVKTGVKVGGNYVKYYGKKLVNPELSREELNEDNATDIYDGLKSLKGSALKVAQMLSMEKNLLPRALCRTLFPGPIFRSTIVCATGTKDI